MQPKPNHPHPETKIPGKPNRKRKKTYIVQRQNIVLNSGLNKDNTTKKGIRHINIYIVQVLKSIFNENKFRIQIRSQLSKAKIHIAYLNNLQTFGQ
jgi:hypothetical protein